MQRLAGWLVRTEPLRKDYRRGPLGGSRRPGKAGLAAGSSTPVDPQPEDSSKPQTQRPWFRNRTNGKCDTIESSGRRQCEIDRCARPEGTVEPRRETVINGVTGGPRKSDDVSAQRGIIFAQHGQ